MEKERQAAEQERRELAAVRDAEHRDREMSQARLIIVERVHPDSWTASGRTPAHTHVVIRNYSSDPIFTLHIAYYSPKVSAPVFVQWSPENDPDGVNPYREPPQVVPTLSPGQATAELHVAAAAATWQ